ncbi:MAG: squalene-hopene/tetraprenyl-beta-curcumene cyclase [Candidatus Paceibacteria bacterium]
MLVGGDRETVIELGEARQRAQEHLVRTQQGDGTWTPLWFGNQQAANKENPVYGTSRVLRAAGVPGNDAWLASLERALVWLLSVQNNDGGYGGGEGLSSTVEETALALEALADAGLAGLGNRDGLCEAVTRGMQFLASATSEGTSFDPQPIGLYFAQLWYSERLYPLIFTVSALESCTRFLKNEDGHA